MCADVVGYSRLMGIDEEGTLAALNAVRRSLVDPTIVAHKGRIVRAMGDGLLIEFNSVLDAVRCAVKIQNEMPEHGAEMPVDHRIRLRLAVAVGDVVTDGDLIYGQGVDIAARLESLAQPGGINVSRAVRDQVRDRLPIAFEDEGEHQVKNVAHPVRAFRVVLDNPAAAPASGGLRKAATTPEKPAVAESRASSARRRNGSPPPIRSNFIAPTASLADRRSRGRTEPRSRPASPTRSRRRGEDSSTDH